MSFKKIIRKNMHLFKKYGILGSLYIYRRIILWHIYHYTAAEKSRYRKVKVNDYEMFIDLKDSGISKALFVYGSRENDQMDIVKGALFKGMSVLDIGANIGYYVIMESKITGPSAGIIAYEPSADNCKLLKKNLRLNEVSDSVEQNQEAVSDKSGTAKFYISDKSNLHTLNPGPRERGDAPFIEVKTVDIYEIIKKHRNIGFIRMDIEGHEVEVLNNLAKAIMDFNVYPKILFETHLSKYDAMKHDIKKPLERLFKLGYFAKTLVSADERNTKLKQKGYRPEKVISTDLVERGIYKGVSNEDAIELVGKLGGVRAALLSKR